MKKSTVKEFLADKAKVRINPKQVALLEADLEVFRDLTQRAVVLLANATPSKVLDEEHSKKWCKVFGKWFAEAQHEIYKPNHANQ